MMSEKFIQLAANYEDWVAVKKLKIDEKTDPRTVMEFLAGLNTSLDRKVEDNLGKVVDLEPLKKHLASIEYGKKENEIAHVLAFVNGVHTNRVINEITAPLAAKGVQKNEVKEMIGFCKVYAMRTALNNCQLKIDYSSIEIPGMKRLMKKKG
jgi:hypothetical protein